MVLAFGLRVQSVIAEKHESKTVGGCSIRSAGHIVSAVRKQGEMNVQTREPIRDISQQQQHVYHTHISDEG